MMNKGWKTRWELLKVVEGDLNVEKLEELELEWKNQGKKPLIDELKLKVDLINENWRKLPKVDENYQKSTKIRWQI